MQQSRLTHQGDCLPALPAESDTTLDSYFLQSWLHIDAATVKKLATEGQRASELRRQLLATAGLGAQVGGFVWVERGLII